MSLDIVFGQTRHQAIADQLTEIVATLDVTGTLYFGYPIIATADERIEVDALLVTREHGLCAFSFATAPIEAREWRVLADAQDRLYFAIEANLRRHESLRNGRDLAIKIQAITLLPHSVDIPLSVNADVVSVDRLRDRIQALPGLTEAAFSKVESALQRVTTIRPPKRRAGAITPRSRGAVLREIESGIAILDQWQKKAAIETPEGPQRIRGLAGSGKTIVLALKAAYLHAQNPDWVIAVTFYSRSLGQQFRDLIRRFCFEHLNDEPNWSNLRTSRNVVGSSGNCQTTTAPVANDP